MIETGIYRSKERKKIRTSIITNGYMISEKILKILKLAEIESIAVSLDGPEWIHDKYRQTGSYQRGNAAIDCLTENNIPVSVITTLHKENVPYLEEFYQLLKRKSIFAWQLQACSPMGNAVKNGIDYSFHFNEVIDFLESHMWESPFAMGIADNIGYFTENVPEDAGHTIILHMENCMSHCIVQEQKEIADKSNNTFHINIFDKFPF
ncbi:MAG: radical SAM protein [Blautia sp.]